MLEVSTAQVNKAKATTLEMCKGAASAGSCDPLGSSGDVVAAATTVGSTANLKTRMNKRLSVVKGHFPKLADCAHFHYDNVDFGSIQLQLVSDHGEVNWMSGSSSKEMVFMVQVTCQGKSWMVRRSYEEFCTLDAHLHQCIYDRRYSQLPELPPLGDRTEMLCPLLSDYLSRLSLIVDNRLNCGPVLTWMEADNRGNRFLLKEEASLNVPAIAAAHVVKRYTAQAADEISIEVGDILSVIDMPPKEETSWWRGKHGFQVGFFPSECVELINEKLPQSVSTSNKTVSKKHGKLLGFLRTFIKSRPSKQKLKQRGILRERVFGCDLGEHLLNSGLDVPQVLVSCSEFIEQHGVVDGIYRHSGVSSNIQKLRHEFDSEMVPDLTKEVYMQDIHCVGSLCKLYFRELPNPLLTYQLYDKFADCMGEMSDDERMVKVHDVIQQLPPPHYRTLEYLIRHLAGLATCCEDTNMHIKNLAIVWAPNLLRSKEIETTGLVGSDPFREVRVQSVVVEFLLSHVDVLFSDSFTSVGKFTQGQQSLARPKSFVSTRLLSLEEAQARTQAPLLLHGAPPSLEQEQYHTVLDMHDSREKKALKGRKTAGSWKTFFAIGKPARKPMRMTSLVQPTMSHTGCGVDNMTLRSAKSEESLSGSGQVQQLHRPRSSSDGLSMAASMETQPIPHYPPSSFPSLHSYDSLLLRDQCHGNQQGEEEDEDDEEGEEGVYMLPDFSGQNPASSWMAEDVNDSSPTFLEDGLFGLGNTRETPSTGSPTAYHCLSHQVRYPITEDPDSVLNQSDAVARRSLILAATAPTQQVFCQYEPSNSSLVEGEAANQSPTHGIRLLPERRSFTKKVVHALSPKVPKSPTLDISQPVSISVPAKVLEMIGGRVGESQQSAPSDSPPPPQMISMLLRSCDFQLTDSCQQELHSKLGITTAGSAVRGPTGAPLPPQQPPLPPPKNPARLMALVLAESANRVLRHQGAAPLPPYRPYQIHHRPSYTGPNKADPDLCYQRSRSADAGELLSSEPNQLSSSVSQRPPPVWRNNSNTDVTEHSQEPRAYTQDSGTLSSETSVSDSVVSDVSKGSFSGEDHTPSPVYTNQSRNSKRSPSSQSQPVRKKPPPYGRQLSAPHLQQKTASTPTTSAAAITTASVSGCIQNVSSSSQQSVPQSQAFPSLLHPSRSESSPLSQVHSFQLSRPKVPPKPLDLVAPQRTRDLPFHVALGPHREHYPLARSDLRRSLDSGRIRGGSK
ncbi:rho GTPase-activating protein 32 [Diretmus argenteus]